MCSLFLLFFFTACGGGGLSSPAPFPDLTPHTELGDTSPTENLILSKSYQGQLVLYLDESIGARFDPEKGLITKSEDQEKNISELKDALHSFSSAQLKPSSALSPEQIDSQRKHLEKLSGKKLRDWNSVFYLEIENPIEAVQVLRKIKKIESVKKAYPKIRSEILLEKPVVEDRFLTNKSFATKGTGQGQTPDLSIHQQYLGAENETGGINAYAAWQQNILGDNVWLVHADGGASFRHEDLPLRPNNGQDLGIFCGADYEDHPQCPGRIAHGTAMGAIMTGIHDNEIGIKGIAPNATYKVDDAPYTNVREEDRDPDAIFAPSIPGGSIMAIILGSSCPNLPQLSSGCLPRMTEPVTYDLIEELSARGITVIAGAGNGGQDLDDPSSYYEFQINLNENPSSAMIVGMGWPNHAVVETSTYGSPVDFFAWGRNVTSAAYPAQNWDWFNNLQPAPFNNNAEDYYANYISGTSPATAIIAGAAVLIQSHAKQLLKAPVLGTEFSYEETRFLMPNKIKEILYASGVAYQDNPEIEGERHIGRQPRVDLALFGGQGLDGQMESIEQYIDRMFNEFPELTDPGQVGPLPDGRLSQIRQAGIGVACVAANPEMSDPLCGYESRCIESNPERSDPDCPFEYRCIPGDEEHSASDCPEDFIWPTGWKTANTLDFDGDGRADLVDWSNGEFKLDLSSVGTGELNYGAWDTIINYPQLPGEVVWPYVEDMNSDGRTDLVLYDKYNGRWYIRFITTDLLSGGPFGDWDAIIDHSATWVDTLEMNPRDSHYSRPHPGDYNADGWNDIAIACSDGMWRIDYGGPNGWDGVFDREIKYLSDERLEDAPGWAYQTAFARAATSSDTPRRLIAYKIPDTLEEKGRLIVHGNLYDDDFDTSIDYMEDIFNPGRYFYVFGGNNKIIVSGIFSGGQRFSIKSFDQTWEIENYVDVGNGNYEIVTESILPDNIYGGSECHPVAADFDGDSYDDRAVMCPDEWRIARSSDNQLITIPLGYNEHAFSLPGRSYAGGISYADVLDIIELEKELDPNNPPAIPVDMPMSSIGN